MISFLWVKHLVSISIKFFTMMVPCPHFLLKCQMPVGLHRSDQNSIFPSEMIVYLCPACAGWPCRKFCSNEVPFGYLSVLSSCKPLFSLFEHFIPESNLKSIIKSAKPFIVHKSSSELSLFVLAQKCNFKKLKVYET